MSKPAKAGILCERPYKGYRGYKVYHKTNNRYYLHMRHIKTGEQKTISYARYLMSVYLQRKLTKNEEVDHKNGIATDDRLRNLQILTPYENKQKLHREYVYDLRVEKPCANCGDKIKVKRSQIKRSKRSFCSRSCSAKFYNAR
jgi:hypothetical protein